MASMPFMYCVLFPVDLRYGWDLRHQKHRDLLSWVDSQLRPLCTTFEPRCKYWSRAGNSRDPETTKRLREEEGPMLKFLAQHAIKIASDNRDALFENPKTSAIWKESPLAALLLHRLFRSFLICMCAFSPEPDGRRSKKETLLVTTMLLLRAFKTCTCQLGHIHLKGYDPVEHQIRTAAAALYPKRFCTSVCRDAETSIRQKHPNTFKNNNVYPVDLDEDDENR